MKIFIRNLLINFALIVLFAHIIPSIIEQNWRNTPFILELFFVTLVIRLMVLLTDKFHSRYPIIEYLLELGMVLSVVLGFGWLFRWYDLAYLWLMVVMIAAVYAAIYTVGIGRTQRDVAFINEQIKLRKRGSDNE